MQGTKDRILEHVLQRREARVDELARAFDITPAAVRRHLDNLRADGLVDSRAVKQPTGRPYYVYFPTDQATRQLPPAYERLLEGVLHGLGERPEIVNTVLESIAEAVAAKHRPEVGWAGDTTARVDRVTGSLRGEGILDTWREDDDGIHLVNASCPYLKAAEMSNVPCESDRKTIELLLGLDVEPLHRIVDGSAVCEYLVREIRQQPSQPSAEPAV